MQASVTEEMGMVPLLLWVWQQQKYEAGSLRVDGKREYGGLFLSL